MMNRKLILPMALLAAAAITLPAAAKVTQLRLVMGNVDAKEIATICKLFEKDYPSIRINPIIVPWDQVDNKFLAMTMGGTKIDVFGNPSAMGWARYARQGLFLDLSPLATRDKKELNPDDFNPMVLDAYKYKGKLISLPVQHFLANSIAYNATMMNEAGLALPPTSWETKDWNWDDMVMYAKKLTKTTDGRVTQWGIDFWGSDNLISYAWAGGGDWLDQASYKDGIVNKVIINSPENIRAYQKIADLASAYQVKPGIAKAKATGGIDGYRKGEMAMWMDAQQLQSPLYFSKKFKWGMAPFPVMESGVKNGFAWMEALAIPKSSQNREAAWTFLKWMTRYGLSNESIKWPQNSARESMWDKALDWWPKDYSALTKAQLKEYVKGGLKYARALPRDMVFGSQAVSDAAAIEIGKAFSGKTSVVQALAMAQKTADIQVKKYMRYK